MNSQQQLIDERRRKVEERSTNTIPSAIDEAVDRAVPIASDQAYASALPDITSIELIQETAQEVTSNILNIPEYHQQIMDHLMNSRDYAAALEMTVNSLISNAIESWQQNSNAKPNPDETATSARQAIDERFQNDLLPAIRKDVLTNIRHELANSDREGLRRELR